MSGLDAKFLYSETPTTHMHTLKVVVFDVSGLTGGFSFAALAQVLGQLLVRLPPFRRRVVPSPWGLGHPVWIEDPGFVLGRHISRRVLAPPGDDRSLAAAVAEFASTPLPRDRPLWALEIVEGLAGKRVAAVVKLHHAVADGSAAVALLQNAIEVATVEPSVAPVDDPWLPEPFPTRRQLLVRAAHEQAVRWRGLPHLARQSIVSARASEHLRRSFDPMPPIPLHHIPKTSFNVSISAERTFAMTSLPLVSLKEIKRAVGTTLNDVYLAVCAGALRRYLSDRGELPGRPLVASVPVSTDPGVSRLSGNHVDNFYVALDTHVPDPLDRLRRIHAGAMSSKEVRHLLGPDLLEQRADVVPPQIFHSTVRLWSRSHVANVLHPPLNVILSNVAGPKETISIGPVIVDSLYSVGPILEGIGLNITAWSYQDDLAVSLLGCPQSVPDPWVIADALHDSLDELRRSVEREIHEP